MKQLFLTVFILGLAAACSTSVVEDKPIAKSPATKSSPSLPAVTLDTPRPIDAAKISLADAKKAYDDNEAIFVDVRGADAFLNEHVRGAINITIGDIDLQRSKLPPDKKIIVYCSCGAEHSSLAWVAHAKQKGIVNAYALLGGTQAWVDAGFPTEKK